MRIIKMNDLGLHNMIKSNQFRRKSSFKHKILLFVILLIVTNTISAFGQTITVTSPNGGEDWQRGTTHTITWNSTGSIANVQIQLFQGTSATQTELITSSTPNDGSYTWYIDSDGIIDNDFRIRISDPTHWGTTYDYSNSYFTLSGTPPAGTITVTSPNGGEDWQRGTSHTIT